MANVGAEEQSSDVSSLSFLAGGGEMGALIRSHDWSITPLGPPHTWPQSLRTAIRIMLTSRQPIWIGWREVSMIRMAVRRLCGQVWGGPSGVMDQS